MRLKQIKLAGFKSFVDLTKVPFPHQMTAVVGPNGCGKSNIIDAVRWVLGESSAKNLRGDAMTDVIFNGASQRKPVGQASVELIFEHDNSSNVSVAEGIESSTLSHAAKLADRNEISVRRQVNREGQNQYFLNGSKCRRRDITDIFLGTGLGPRSYAIIEQGTISRLIESKPQELRVFVEEAAGISQYKERRRETELKIKHTNENLSRLNDIRFEVEQQLEKLHIQAESAKRYKSLKHQERTLKSELLAMQWQQHQISLVEFTDAINEEEQQVAILTSQINQQESGLIEIQSANDIEQVKLKALQHEQIELNKQHAIIEQKHKYSSDLALKNNASRDKVGRQLEKLAIENKSLSIELEDLNDKVSNKSAQLVELETQQSSERDALNSKQICYSDAKAQWLTANQQYEKQRQEEKFLSDKRTSLYQEKQRIEKQQTQLFQQESSLQEHQTEPQNAAKLEALNTEISGLNVAAKSYQIKTTELKDKLSEHKQHQSFTENELKHNEKAVEQLTTEMNQRLNWQQTQIDSLTQLNEPITLYFETLTVEEHWQVAVSNLLQQWLHAPIVNQLTSSLLTQLSLSQSMLIDAQELAHTAVVGTIAEKLSSTVGILPWLNEVYTADDIDSAKRQLSELQKHQSVICSDGTWLGHGFVIKVKNQQEAQLFPKQQRLTELKSEVTDLHHKLVELEQNIGQTTTEITAQLEIEAGAAEQLIKLNDEKGELEHQIAAARHKRQWQGEQLTQIQHTQKENEQRLAEILADITHIEQRAEQLELPDNSNNLDQLRHHQENLANEVANLQRKVEADVTQHHHMALSVEQLKMQQVQVMQSAQHKVANIDLLTEQLHQLEKESLDDSELSKMMVELGELNEQLKELAIRADAYQKSHSKFIETKQQCDAQLAEQRTVVEAKVEQINQAKLAVQNDQIRSITLSEQLEELGQNPANIMENLPKYASEKSTQRELNKVSKSLSALGAINLTAIDEYQAHISRKNHLDLQYEDLTLAISTLESAIAKIDQESRQKFKTTFEQVNQDLQVLFPKVFGGGSAYLELTSHDLLETGVTIMARPPGKKNSTIHLLSGGEKALTALSLVFAIFRLNPAPFCMLDEVDAPLDDTNVGRFCNLVREMSQTVQFIYISHNKIAMEMASHLTGVTMLEPGVSRMVSVDIDEAIAMAEVS